MYLLKNIKLEELRKLKSLILISLNPKDSSVGP